jgi:hypothetical protein
MDDWHAAAIFERPDLVRVEATVRRVGASYVSVTLPEPYAAASFRALDVPIAQGAAITVAGLADSRLDVDRLKGFRVMVVRVPFGGGMRHVLIEQPDVMRQTSTADDPAWLKALVLHGLVPEKQRLDPEQRKQTPVVALSSIYQPRQAVARGFVHYGSNWRNDTDDVVRDLGVLAGAPDVFRCLALRDDAIDLQVRLPDGSVEKDTVPIGPGQLDELAKRMNAWLERCSCPRRIFVWSIGNDRLAYLGRTPDEVEAMRRDGLAEANPLALAGVANVKDETDWSDL